MGRKLALIVGNTEYTDSRFSTLSTPSEDVTSLAELLKDPSIGGFDELEPLINQEERVVSRTVEKFFAGKMRDDLLLFYFSGHGMLDEEGQLYFALKDTDFETPRSSSLSAEFVREVMDRTRSQRVVLILDCCHSGAFARGQKGVIGGSVGTKNAFEPSSGYGRWVLTATDATQYAWEGNQVVATEDTAPRTSVFTRYLVQGLKEGAADLDQDGLVSVRDLSDYVYDQVVKQQLKQTPSLWTYKEQGNLFIANNPKPVLPRDLLDAIQSPYPNVRYEAVQQLIHLADSPSAGVAQQAKDALARLITDDSRKVSKAAAHALGTKTPSERFADDRFAKLATQPPQELPIVPQDESWQDRLKKTARLAKLNTKHSVQAGFSKVQEVFAQTKEAIRKHRSLVIRVEISLVALIVAGVTWRLVPTNSTQVASNATQTQAPAKPADPPTGLAKTETPNSQPAVDSTPVLKPPVETPTTTAAPAAPVLVSELVMRDYLIQKVEPTYPLTARNAHMQGQVVLQALIDKEGAVQNVSTVNGKTALAAAATTAVKQWRYRPYPDQANPIPVQTLITFHFNLKPAAQPQTPANPVQSDHTISLASNTAPTLGNDTLPDGTKIYSRRDGVSEPQKLYCPNPLYTKQASKDGLEGPVTLQIVVKPDGSVGNVRVLQGLGKGLDQSAAKTVSTWRFTPSMKNGKPVAVRVDVTINFILQH